MTLGRMGGLLAAMDFRVLLLLLALGTSSARAPEASTLLALKAAWKNWDAATAALPGAPWINGTDPCGSASINGGSSGGNSSTAWKGVTCKGGQVSRLQLAGLGLAGTLPELQDQLPALESMDLADNQLSGSLPASWGAAFPSLALLYLQSNNLTGAIPAPQWTLRGFATPALLDIRAGNTDICGPVLPLDPSLFPPGAASGTASVIPDASSRHTGDDTTTLMLFEDDLFFPGTRVTITNWLGSCMQACSAVPGGLTQPPEEVQQAGLLWPPVIQTNIFDMSWVYNMSIADLVNLNPGVRFKRPGDALEVPCYTKDKNVQFDYFGADVAFGQFAGGNQLPGADGLPGAMAAARVVGAMPNRLPAAQGDYYVGSLAPGGLKVVEPVFWFVDLQATFKVSMVVLTAGDAMKNASIYIGSNGTSLFDRNNTLVASNLNLASGQQLAVNANGTFGRYIIVYTGLLSEGQMSLKTVEVYTFGTNSANNMPVTASYLSSIGRGGSGQVLEALVDSNQTTCVQLQPDVNNPRTGNSTAWAFVDLGYYGTVGAVALAAGPGTAANTTAWVFVTQNADESPPLETACNSQGQLLEPGQWAVGACNQTGRFVTVSVAVTAENIVADLCELQVWLTQKAESFSSGANYSASNVSSNSGSSIGSSSGSSADSAGSLSSGAIVGIVVGSVSAGAALTFLLAYLCWRHRWLQQQLQVVAVSSKAQGWGDQHSDDLERGESGDTGASPVDEKAEAQARSDVGAVKADADAGSEEHQQPMPRFPEWWLLKWFIKSLRRNNASSALHSLADKDASTMGGKAFAVTSDAIDPTVDARQATTDLTRLPPPHEVAPADIQLIEMVGSGSFGEVWLGMYCGAFVAVKILAKIKSDNLTGSMQQQIAVRNLKKEALLMSSLRHPNVCLYLGACTDPPCLLFEYCAKSSLDRVLKEGLQNSHIRKQLSWARLLSMALDSAKGMLYLHTRLPPIVHRDLKSANLLVDSQWRVKVADFSLSRTIDSGHKAHMMTVMATNPRWLAPEVLGGLPGQLPADVWAFGTCLWELCTWALPYEDLNTFQIIAMVQSQGALGLWVPEPDELPAGTFHMYQEYVELMRSCLARDPAARPEFSEIVQRLGEILAAEVKSVQASASQCGSAV